MPHDTHHRPREEVEAITALLGFGSTTTAPGAAGAPRTADSRPPSTVTQARSFHSTSTDSSVAVVTEGGSVASVNGSVISGSDKTVPTGSKRPPPLNGTHHPSSNLAIAPAPLANTEKPPAAKRTRIEVNGNKGGNDSKEIHIIQDCHAVLGDRHCAGRTTIATVILREIKLKYKEKYKGKGVDNWYDEAMADYYERVKEKVPRFTQDDYETVLVYSYSPKTKGKAKSKANDEVSSRIEQPNCYKYHTDEFPKYGKAKVPEAVKFFFNSKDAPTLPKEISKYRVDFERLKSGSKQPPLEKMSFFEDFLKFCEDNLRKAKDEEMAQQLLHSLNLIPTLRRLWETLKASTNKRSPLQFKTVAAAVMEANQPPAAIASTTTTIAPPPPSSSLQPAPQP